MSLSKIRKSRQVADITFIESVDGPRRVTFDDLIEPSTSHGLIHRFRSMVSNISFRKIGKNSVGTTSASPPTGRWMRDISSPRFTDSVLRSPGIRSRRADLENAKRGGCFGNMKRRAWYSLICVGESNTISPASDGTDSGITEADVQFWLEHLEKHSLQKKPVSKPWEVLGAIDESEDEEEEEELAKEEEEEKELAKEEEEEEELAKEEEEEKELAKEEEEEGELAKEEEEEKELAKEEEEEGELAKEDEEEGELAKKEEADK